MAKMFYTLEETRAALGQSEDQIKQLTREGRLREFRDGPRLMFKADQVDALRTQIGGGGNELHDSGLPISLADTGGGTGIGLSMADSISADSHAGSGVAAISGSGLAGISGSGLGSGLAGGGGAGSGMMNLKEDTALAADLGLSGSVGGMPSPGRTGTGVGLSGSHTGSGGAGSVGSRQGINVFGDDTHAGADPMAQTALPGSSGSVAGGSMADLNLEGIGSGSGLLDLTRESDETSLGAELLDEIGPGSGGSRGSRPMAPPDTGSMSGIKLDAPRGGVSRGGGVVTVEAPDAWADAFGAMMLGAGLVVLVALFALVNAVMGVQPDLIKSFDRDNEFLIIFVGGLVVAGLFLAFGKLISMSTGRR